jgi:hypothetical protein
MSFEGRRKGGKISWCRRFAARSQYVSQMRQWGQSNEILTTETSLSEALSFRADDAGEALMAGDPDPSWIR